MSSGFRPGDAVVVRRGFGPGHIRTPHFIRGHRGVVERVAGRFPNPEELAYGRSGKPPVTLYRVRFPQAEVWKTYRGSAADTIDVDLYEHWLEAAP